MNSKYYYPTKENVWQGRIDGEEENTQRWHQAMQCIDLSKNELPKLHNGRRGIALLGFACDEGVRRNLGRIGAVAGPGALRKACANFPVHFRKNLLVDVGDIVCDDGNLEASQDALRATVENLLLHGYMPLLLGGGHEITYGHACACYNILKASERQLGIINFDAHFDIRKPGPAGPSSGTGFYQLAMDAKARAEQLRFLALGIQPNSNTGLLFETVKEHGGEYLPADYFNHAKMDALLQTIKAFINNTDGLYITVDLDVFSAAFAPGVSATAYNGITPGENFLECFRYLLRSGKVMSIDIAELNPSLDIDNRTAKLGASLMFEVVSAHLGMQF
ncbi:formiminoglutamase [Chitinophaga skermanii]|uniref:Formimidoylglutamase n=1 Tax=Chitinophaga skermanii TaxID=331697 RepID=A0A327QCV6_9BACT|nr:formimidoylglutamase [Chitinophaga skermanii]RAJ02466.1 formiminoglutamase [Chitinophaga skermanii]